MNQQSNTESARAYPTPDVLLRRAHELADYARMHARETERNRRVSAAFMNKLKDAELHRVLQPKRYGGFEHGFKLFAEIGAAIAAGCPSSGWVASIGMAHQWLIALFPEAAQEDVWGRNGNAVAYGSYAPAGKLVLTDEGYSVTGKWAFSSGCDNAQWFVLGVMLPQGDHPPKSGFALVDASACTIEDNWHTMGLAGTGSKIVVAENVTIPRHAVALISELVSGQAPGSKLTSNSLYKIPLLAVLPLCLAAPALGMATGALSSFVDNVQGRVTRGAVAGSNNRMAEFATVQLRVAEASGCIDAGRLLMFRDIAEAEESATKGLPIDVDMRIRNRLDHSFCTKLFVQAVDALFLASGGNAIYLDKPIQQYWRDIHAAGVHISLNWDAVGTMFGQHTLGLEPKGQF